MKRFIIEKSEDEFYTSHSGAALIGLCLNRYTPLTKLLYGVSKLKKGAIAHADVVRGYIGLLCLGKSDFAAIEGFRQDRFFRDALGLAEVPSEPTLRQRMKEHAQAFRTIVNYSVTEFLQNSGALFSALATGHVPLDIDVFTMDNSGTKKQGVSRTYMGFDGFAPIAAYLALEGWLLEIEHREGSQHSQKNFIPFLARVLHKALKLTAEPLLVRIDSAHDAWETRIELAGHERVDYILKWNPRGQGKTLWHRRAFAEGRISEPRPGKRVALLSVRDTHQWTDEVGTKRELTCRRVVRVIERTIDKKGQLLLEPDIEMEGWWTSLKLPAEKIITLYEDHGTSEQFHSELKTDMDLERLPAENFEVNSLVMACAALAYNILRFIGQLGLLGDKTPVRHSAKRRRLKTVIQELMYLAARLIATGHRLYLRFSRHSGLSFAAFDRVYRRLAYG
ncbi:transposase, IS4 family [Desulfuromonas soudanensis]|uniref:Transposase, IS4 family n=1 Tax=Desulfuromonas soudanensis TaxID=1603606 RepID=A0A0M4D2Q7_9BACT|nr:IS1380 family transposase [Desulfuromonas soudanensis]ALC17321.1 transposase, IS4 family [Desulfuromonas soudanensis]ALC17615.1 transposase, IS4 family [Desulfuromonas soudanensis]ALC17985.1 transposase, IS4 family [Desulfuromonas soudanensis]